MANTTKNKETTTEMIAGEVDQRTLELWKAQHKQVIIIDVELEDKSKIRGYFKKPGRDIIANCVNDATAGQIFEAREFLANSTWLGGDTQFQTDEDVAITAQVQLWKSLNFLKAEAVKY
ncbi:hypothetical protein ACSBL2_24565 [Pedobacter sp. AW31-3R]|uniref:hypothetical protein n=1 Tax=Pedobacter sp. AW31-3R TaxID=3445781 RepID=UPI003F9F50AF